MWCLTFEVRRDQRQDARPGLVKMYAYHQTGPGGLPLGLASTEGLGLIQCLIQYLLAIDFNSSGEYGMSSLASE